MDKIIGKMTSSWMLKRGAVIVAFAFSFLIGCAFWLTVLPATEETADLSSDHIMYVVRRLSPFTEYTFSVMAKNIIGEGPSTEVTVKTTEQGKIHSDFWVEV